VAEANPEAEAEPRDQVTGGTTAPVSPETLPRLGHRSSFPACQVHRIVRP